MKLMCIRYFFLLKRVYVSADDEVGSVLQKSDSAEAPADSIRMSRRSTVRIICYYIFFYPNGIVQVFTIYGL